MADKFALFYVVFFGAFLSSEISTGHFRPNDTWSIWGWRVFWLVLARSLYLAAAIVAMRLDKLSSDGFWAPFRQLLFLLFLSTPVLGFQQLSYLRVPPPNFMPSTEGLENAQRSWLLMTALCLVLPVAALVWCWKKRPKP